MGTRLGTMIMYVISYVISMFNFILGLVLFLVILPSTYLILTEVQDPDDAIIYVMCIWDGYMLESSYQKALEIDSNEALINDFAAKNNYEIAVEKGVLILIVPDYNSTEQSLAAEYNGNHQSDALTQSYYDLHLAKIAEFSKSIGNIRISVKTKRIQSLGDVYNGLYVVENNINESFKLEESEF